MPNLPQDALLKQIAAMEEAKTVLQNAIDELTGSIDPEIATWDDVSRLQHIADAASIFLSRVKGE